MSKIYSNSINNCALHGEKPALYNAYWVTGVMFDWTILY